MAIKKVKFPNNTVVDINDTRIPGVDTTPTSGSTNVVTSSGVYDALQNILSQIVGFDSVSSNQDGTLIITLSNGDTITVDLNHNHPQYPKYVHLEDESDMPSSPDSETMYLIDGEGGGSSYVLPAATASALGGIKVGSVISTPAINAISSTSGRYYALQCDSSGSAFVNVPWEAGSGGGGTTVSWGTEGNNTVPLTVGGTSKTLILSSAKVTSLSSSSTDNQVPSAKCVYDLVGDIETLLTALL